MKPKFWCLRGFFFPISTMSHLCANVISIFIKARLQFSITYHALCNRISRVVKHIIWFSEVVDFFWGRPCSVRGCLITLAAWKSTCSKLLPEGCWRKHSKFWLQPAYSTLTACSVFLSVCESYLHAICCSLSHQAVGLHFQSAVHQKANL